MTTDRCKVRVLDADTYDTIEFAALAFGGIGSGRDFLVNGDCLCVHGMVAEDTTAILGALVGIGCGNAALDAAGISRWTNDDGVWRVWQGWQDWTDSRRISFAAWCNALGVVRGPHPTEQP